MNIPLAHQYVNKLTPHGTPKIQNKSTKFKLTQHTYEISILITILCRLMSQLVFMFLKYFCPISLRLFGDF